jgi:mono/diheme cytochrome c family protein
MAEAVDLSLSKLARSDIAAIVTYVRSVKPIHNDEPPLPAGTAADSPKVLAVEDPQGKRVFEGNCASCHSWTGAAAILDEAQLTGARAVNDPSGANAVQMILGGSGDSQTGRAYRPSFGEAYSDAEIAAVANYVTGRFGFRPSHTTPDKVAMLRAQH